MGGVSNYIDPRHDFLSSGKNVFEHVTLTGNDRQVTSQAYQRFRHKRKSYPYGELGRLGAIAMDPNRGGE
jgi:hypothetical protein